MFSGVQTCVLGVGELLLRAKPAESAAQFLGAVPIVPTSMGHHRFLRLPGEHSISKAVDDPRSAERALLEGVR